MFYFNQPLLGYVQSSKPKAKTQAKGKGKALTDSASTAQLDPSPVTAAASGSVPSGDTIGRVPKTDAKVNGQGSSKSAPKSKKKKQEVEEEEVDDTLYCIVSVLDHNGSLVGLKPGSVLIAAADCASPSSIHQCQQKYDPERLMIACDRCDNWYHTDCLGIPEERVGLTDRFYCPQCERGQFRKVSFYRCRLDQSAGMGLLPNIVSAETGLHTTYKPACAREDCANAAQALSKYCSDWCGIQVAADRLETKGAKLDLSQLWQAVEFLDRREAEVSIVDSGIGSDTSPQATASSDLPEPPPSDDDRKLLLLQEALQGLVDKRSSLERFLSIARTRSEYLQTCIRRSDALIREHQQNNPTAVTKKSKSYSGTSGDAPCGFDVRVVWDDGYFEAWSSSDEYQALLLGDGGSDQQATAATLEEDGLVCMVTRRKCDRHGGWQKMREADFAGGLTTHAVQSAHTRSSVICGMNAG